VSALRVLVDDVALSDEDARAFWKRFSAWMEEHPADLEGFAGSEGLASVHPEMHEGLPVLRASRSKSQGPYVVAPSIKKKRASRSK
jgi:hypothetical protein